MATPMKGKMLSSSMAAPLAAVQVIVATAEKMVGLVEEVG